MNVHNELGCGFLEPVYQEALAIEFELMNIPFEREKHINVMYKNNILSHDYYIDFLCYDQIVVELKAVSSLVASHKSQIINYLCAAKKEVGLLVNFGQPSLTWKRVKHQIKSHGSKGHEICARLTPCESRDSTLVESKSHGK
jgi:GxxExxY protein